MELQFARDSSTLLPKVDPIFRVQITVPETGKRRQKTPGEFGAALKVLLGSDGVQQLSDHPSPDGGWTEGAQGGSKLICMILSFDTF